MQWGKLIRLNSSLAKAAELIVNIMNAIASIGFLNGLIEQVNATSSLGAQKERDHQSNGIFWIARIIASGV